MKIITTVHIYFEQYSWEEKGKFAVFSFKVEDSEYRTYVSEQQIEVDVPEDYDPREQKIAVLVAQKQKVMADYQKTVAEINNSISNLQALEYTA